MLAFSPKCAEHKEPRQGSFQYLIGLTRSLSIDSRKPLYAGRGDYFLSGTPPFRQKAQTDEKKINIQDGFAFQHLGRLQHANSCELGRAGWRCQHVAHQRPRQAANECLHGLVSRGTKEDGDRQSENAQLGDKQDSR